MYSPMVSTLFEIHDQQGGVFIEVKRTDFSGFDFEQKKFLLRKFELADFGTRSHLVHATSYLKKGAKVDAINESLDQMFDVLAQELRSTDLFLLSHFLSWQIFDLYNVRLLSHGTEIMKKFNRVKDVTLSQVTLFNRFGFSSDSLGPVELTKVLERDTLTRFVYHIAPDLLAMLSYQAVGLNSDRALQKFAQEPTQRTYLRWVLRKIVEMDPSFATKVLAEQVRKVIDRTELEIEKAPHHDHSHAYGDDR